MNFYICFVKTRKKIDKYFKINKIKNKHIIDINKIIDEENIDTNNPNSVRVLKLIIWNRINNAKSKNKDIYYMPNFLDNDKLNVNTLLSYKEKLLSENDNFNLLCFFNEFVGTTWLNELFENLDEFDNSQILKDY